MNKLDKDHLYLLIDEPIYVLPDHGDHPTGPDPKDEMVVNFKGENNKGICVFAGNASDEDLAFLFKGLNALDVELGDIALFSDNFNPGKNYPEHSIRLRFGTETKSDPFILSKEPIADLEAIPLSKIKADLELKKQFWLRLKELFGKS